MTVADSSSLAKYVNREPNWKEVESYIKRGVATVPLAFKEISNTLRKRVREGQLDKEFSRKVVTELLRLKPFSVLNQEEVLPDALSIAIEEDVTIYDAVFIAASEKMGESLLTSDARQAEAAKKRNVHVIYIP